MMRAFPREIEADLLLRGVDINDWHRGRMSSRRLLLLIDALPEDSAYRRERRDGDWSEKEYMAAALLNHMILLRADQAAIHAKHKLKINLWESPMQTRETERLDDKIAQLRQHVVGQLNKAKKR